MAGIEQLCTELGVPMDPQLFVLALTHRSYAYENGGLPTNERLEFLGDSVLGLIVTEHLYRVHPELSEGELAKLRAAVVNARALAQVARSLGIGPQIRLGRGEITTGGADKSSILADTMEALIGAVYLAHGMDGARLLVHRLFDPLMERAAQLGAGLDWKTSLQELTSTLGLGAPRYEITESGPDHDKRFEAVVVLGELRFGHGRGRNKKQAEQEAAGSAFAELRERQQPTAEPGTPEAGTSEAGEVG
ncbi:ribonuclease III [Enemella evansiae]|uniref:Ribonuclease 3 n=1 Tax=Enemella evansiae TaxID=2016499 RepID=A0A255G5L8_9ACTN|nr:ribonuclease III [Enemella evansiae]OYO09686.1 ribonuclease III [Enemella evansiae]